ncbi:GNAT family N-acetyltransferase [Thalassotalea maritima]|uniref:GNAT family N-acetyltransferase n=1 Tax=Thalassotalea maritima TaxID=3242416 RepID=UPI0035295282
MRIDITPPPNNNALKTLSQGIQRYNQDHLDDDVVFEADKRFAAFVYNDEHQVVGGIRANGFWNYCIIELLWLAPQCRGTGIGTQLMADVEAYAKRLGFAYIRAETLDFQAKGFYVKCGYRLYGELPDHPKGHTTYCLFKSLK